MSAPRSRSSPDAAVLRVRGMSKHFGGLPALDGLSLVVDVGEILAVVGPNGAGKTTLLQLLNGTLEPTRMGTLTFRGVDLTGLRPHRIRRMGLATVRQSPRGFGSLTVRQNVAVGAMFGGPEPRSESESSRIADQQLALVGLVDVAGSPLDRLTLHQQRYVELARALAGHPSLLLLDEVMSGLNPREVDASVTMLRRIRDELGTTLVWVEHVMRAVTALADRVVVLHLGRELAQGDPRAVLRDRRVVAAYLGEVGEAGC